MNTYGNTVPPPPSRRLVFLPLSPPTLSFSLASAVLRFLPFICTTLILPSLWLFAIYLSCVSLRIARSFLYLHRFPPHPHPLLSIAELRVLCLSRYRAAALPAPSTSLIWISASPAPRFGSARPRPGPSSNPVLTLPARTAVCRSPPSASLEFNLTRRSLCVSRAPFPRSSPPNPPLSPSPTPLRCSLSGARHRQPPNSLPVFLVPVPLFQPPELPVLAPPYSNTSAPFWIPRRCPYRV